MRTLRDRIAAMTPEQRQTIKGYQAGLEDGIATMRAASEALRAGLAELAADHNKGPDQVRAAIRTLIAAHDKRVQEHWQEPQS
jgi:hypothetical protein